MLDQYIANLYGVETRRLNEQVKRNKTRFPEDFMFQLTKDEFEILKSQIATSSWGGRRTPPYAFTEQGLAMLSGVLNSQRAIEVNIAIMRTFVQLRSMLRSHDELSKKLKNLEKKYDSQFKIVFDAIHEIMNPNKPQKKRQIGFRGNN
ncbi:MAG: ORF6N domain-containing protein [Thermodesulfobacteriota bacterium]